MMGKREPKKDDIVVYTLKGQVISKMTLKTPVFLSKLQIIAIYSKIEEL